MWLAAVLVLGGGAACGSADGDDPAGSTPSRSTGSTGHVARRCVAEPAGDDLTDPVRADVARMIVASAENSTLVWESRYGYIEYDVEGDPAENRGYTGGIVGFTSKTHDMLDVVRAYVSRRGDAALARYVPALEAVAGTPSRAGLGPGFVAAWREAAADPAFGEVQRERADALYVVPAVRRARADGLGPLGQFAYVDAMIMHGPGELTGDLGGIRARAVEAAEPPSEGGDERRYLTAFLDARVAAMSAETAHADTSRVEQAQRRWLADGNLDLALPLTWSVYGDEYRIDACS